MSWFSGVLLVTGFGVTSKLRQGGPFSATRVRQQVLRPNCLFPMGDVQEMGDDFSGSWMPCEHVRGSIDKLAH